MKPLERLTKGGYTNHTDSLRNVARRVGTSTQGSRGQRHTAKSWRRYCRGAARAALKKVLKKLTEDAE